MESSTPWRGFNWGPGLFIILYHAFLLVGLPIYFSVAFPGGLLTGLTVLMVALCGISITAGYHRYYSHKTYQVHPAIESILLLFGTLSGQGSVIRWSYDHRIHHAYVDTDRDPYAITKGFWYAHILWIFEEPVAIESNVVSDLEKKPWLTFQDRYYPLLFAGAMILNLILFTFITGDFLGSLFIGLFFRLFLNHHTTWFINSLAHTWGDKPFSQEQSAVNNFLISLVTYGEGYHNYHHTFANDYRNGVRWYHFDPTKWLIWGLSKLGLAKNLKAVDPLTIQKRMVLEGKNLLQNRLKDLWYVKKEELEIKVQEFSDEIILKIARIRELRKELKNHPDVEQIRKEIDRVRQDINQDYKRWQAFYRKILKLKPIPA